METSTLVFAGTPYSGNGEVTLQKTEGAEFSGWNLIGNPFAETAYINKESFYRMNDGRSEIIAATNSAIAPMEGIFVYAENDDDEVTFSTQAPGKGRGPKPELEQVVLSLSRPSTGSGTGSIAVIDRAIVRFGDPSTGSGASQTLPKFQINKNSTKLYIPQGGKDYAIASVGRDVARYVTTGVNEMPLNFKASENGTYTITVNTDNVEMSYLHLIDNMTGADVDLLAATSTGSVASYTFNARTTDYESRFKLVFAVGPSTGSGTFAFIDAAGNIIVDGEGTLQVIDVMGRVVLSGDAINRVSTGGMTAGVYVLRLINGEDVRTQKIVIR